MERSEIKTDKAPQAIGPYSQGVVAGGFIYVSGQIPVDPATGNVVEGGIEVQTERVLRNVQAVIEAAGASMKEVVKTTVFLKDITKFTGMNGVYEKFFSRPYPARATVGVSALPKGVLVEIDAVAVKSR